MVQVRAPLLHGSEEKGWECGGGFLLRGLKLSVKQENKGPVDQQAWAGQFVLGSRSQTYDI